MRRMVLLPAPEGPASARHRGRPPRDVQREVAQRDARAKREHRRGPRPARSFTTSRIAPLSATSTAERASAALKSVEKRSKIASGAVCVTPRKLPANISVAPNSPSARPQASARPVPSDGSASGTATRPNVRASEAPSVREASTIRGPGRRTRPAPGAGRTGLRRTPAPRPRRGRQRQLDAEVGQRRTKDPLRAERGQQPDARRRRRQDQRQLDQRQHPRAPAEAARREQIGGGGARRR